MHAAELKKKLEELGIRPAKIRGQNFLIDDRVLDQIVRAADLSKEDTVLEVGPGLGALTERLQEAAGRVIAVEIDLALALALERSFADAKSVKIMHGDALQILPKLTKEIVNYKVAANIPYNITSAVLERFLNHDPAPELIVLLVQKEIADKILAKPPKISRLSLFVNYFGKPSLLMRVPPSAFWPSPKVHSAVLRVERHSAEVLGAREAEIPREKFFEIVRAGFLSPRRKLFTNLSVPFGIPKDLLWRIFEKAGVSRDARPSELRIEDWLKISALIFRLKSP